MIPTRADLAQLVVCKHNCHQIDAKGIGEKIEGTSAYGAELRQHLTTCPDHPTFNLAFAVRDLGNHLLVDLAGEHYARTHFDWPPEADPLDIVKLIQSRTNVAYRIIDRASDGLLNAAYMKGDVMPPEAREYRAELLSIAAAALFGLQRLTQREKALEMPKPDTCPYCGSPWGMTTGCAIKCDRSQEHRAIVNASAKEEGPTS